MQRLVSNEVSLKDLRLAPISDGYHDSTVPMLCLIHPSSSAPCIVNRAHSSQLPG